MPTAKRCCAECFGDHGLRDSIIPSISVDRGSCSYCGASDVPLVPPHALGDVFGLLINTYEQDDGGRELVELLRDDWLIFDNPSMTKSNAKELLAEVLDDGEIVRKTFRASAKYQSDRLSKWELLRGELMHENRYFPETILDLDRLRALFEQLHARDAPVNWFRARLQADDTPFPIAQMGAPPKRVASHGRANPAGIPYLYLGSAAETAIAEVRPHTGEKACVATFSIPSGLKIVDLRNPRKLVSPFLLSDENEIGSLRSDIPFMERVGEELTRPIIPSGASIDYVPSQYLCEYIKKCGYAGVLYRSSVSSGFNLALFQPSQASPGVVTQYGIERVSVSVTAL